MKYRTIENIFKNEHAHWVGNGFRVKQYFPSGRGEGFMQRFSPFLLLDYNEPHLFKGTSQRMGVDAHPHKGFETVTFAFKGKVEHGDNKGHSGVIEPGDIQWMTAGKGIIHKEFHEREYAKDDRIFHMIQLWVNLPKAHKLTEPKYQAIQAAQMGQYQSEEKDVKLTVYAGEIMGVKGPASTFSPMNIYKVDLQKGAVFTAEGPASFNTGFLVLGGAVRVNEEKQANTSDFVLLQNDGDAFKIEALTEDTEVFVLSGEPLHEPIAAMGPFVMNTQEEIWQANMEFQEGKFGSFDF